MASTPTTRNRLNKQAQGDNIDAWGNVLNTGVFELVDEALDGVTTIAITGNVTLSSANYATDQARRRILRLTGSPGASYIVTIPGVEKYYLVHNTTNAAQQLKAGGLAASVPSNTLTVVYCDGTDSYAPSATINTAIGSVVDFAGLVVPSGWLLCYGQAISRITFSSLFQVISTTYGVGNGTTTFNVPDLRGRAVFGKDDMGGAAASRVTVASGSSGAAMGGAGGSQLVQLHGHTATVNDPGHVHLGYRPATGSLLNPASANTNSDGVLQATGQSATTGITVSNSTYGSGNAQNMPPFMIFNKIIYSGV
jgi:microcystin-dependent protein